MSITIMVNFKKEQIKDSTQKQVLSSRCTCLDLIFLCVSPYAPVIGAFVVRSINQDTSGYRESIHHKLCPCRKEISMKYQKVILLSILRTLINHTRTLHIYHACMHSNQPYLNKLPTQVYLELGVFYCPRH